MKKKKIKINFLSVLALILAILSGSLLLHDMFIYAIIPLAKGNFYMLTYFGFFVDMYALFLLESSIQYLVEVSNKKTVK